MNTTNITLKAATPNERAVLGWYNISINSSILFTLGLNIFVAACGN